ncbi:hypothetical protein AB0B10_25090 [Micromonospora arborensis]|uniref:hypothetical protein n=1 Tax=Micromonospora arborensis TaxID=2116518 RepID=UPI003406E504
MSCTTTRAAEAETAPSWRLAPPQGRLVTIEGVWGAGKTTAAQLVATKLRRAGFRVQVVHYGGEPGSIGRLSAFLEQSPLRARTGLGGYALPHHSSVDVLLRLCREAHHHVNCFRPALALNDVVLVDHGVYSKLAWALAVLTETTPAADPARTLERLQALVAPWFCEPDVPVFLDTPWPLARERAIARGRGGGDPAAIERLLFLPRYTAAYRQVLAGREDRVPRVRVGLRAAGVIAEEITDRLLGTLRAAPLSATEPQRG